MLVDYHAHTDNSFDCKTPMLDMCMRAVELGVVEIAFTDHFNNHLRDIDLGFYDPDRFFSNIELCRAKFPQMTILAGVELGEPHRWHSKVRPVIEQYPYDLVLGSVHWIGDENIFDKRYYHARTPDQAYRAYFGEVIQMIEGGGFDILAHVDLPKRRSFEIYGSYDSRAYEALIREIWQACIDHHITPEINTKGLRLSVDQLHPTSEALAWYVEMGGKNITIGSDAHNPDNLAAGFEAAQQSALDAGLTQTCRFAQRQVVGWHSLV